MCRIQRVGLVAIPAHAVQARRTIQGSGVSSPSWHSNRRLLVAASPGRHRCNVGHILKKDRQCAVSATPTPPTAPLGGAGPLSSEARNLTI
ncbi:MAG: hypothetical protein BJ554DRAFT_4734 [Olpidium bornovanus]|uniref:Uncharacterized protein n=1 Tax=Olpidium bornovanus TaxID=278681 RepID=A0A8H7ZLV6_9FUNG|nr:MAG: hypothetical protein BJ554DRAFT_4734 [Olpidium bornovanus]